MRKSVTDILLASVLNTFRKSPAACMLENLLSLFYHEQDKKGSWRLKQHKIINYTKIIVEYLCHGFHLRYFKHQSCVVTPSARETNI